MQHDPRLVSALLTTLEQPAKDRRRQEIEQLAAFHGPRLQLRLQLSTLEHRLAMQEERP